MNILINISKYYLNMIHIDLEKLHYLVKYYEDLLSKLKRKLSKPLTIGCIDSALILDAIREIGFFAFFRSSFFPKHKREKTHFKY